MHINISSYIALGIALVLVLGVLSAVFLTSMGVGALEFLFGKPKIKFLKTNNGSNGFAFGLNFWGSKEPVSFNQVRVRLFNPFGSPTQVDLIKQFDPQKSSFEADVDFGPGCKRLLEASGMERATIQVELQATKEGVTHQFDYNAQKFLNLRANAVDTVEVEDTAEAQTTSSIPAYATGLPRNMVADTEVSGKETFLKIASNPAFAEAFGQPVPGSKTAGGGAGAAGGEALPDFPIAKLWIEDGCIICDACSDIFPEVFHVDGNPCTIKPEAVPGSELFAQGLRIQEAAEACPVEIIKFNK